jgi:hypothetical protein
MLTSLNALLYNHIVHEAIFILLFVGDAMCKNYLNMKLRIRHLKSVNSYYLLVEPYIGIGSSSTCNHDTHKATDFRENLHHGRVNSLGENNKVYWIAYWLVIGTSACSVSSL